MGRRLPLRFREPGLPLKGGIRIEPHTGPRAELRPLFELAEDSARELDSYIDSGEVLVALEDDRRIVGHVQLIERGELEIKNMAVLESHRRRGIGRALLRAAIERARERSFATVLVATAAADVDNLRFYQRAGFRMRSVERDAFTAATGYPPGLEVDGIELRDRVWLDLRLDGEAAAVQQLRVARHTERLEQVVAFYRDGLGLPEVGRFSGHAGYDGVFLELPGTAAHLELTSGGGHGGPAPHPESLLVLYLGDQQAVRAAAARLGTDPVAPANPYWAGHGLTFEDPDGFRVVLVPERWER
jgi:ribosomal protein S18 acetylase RimI-like enzyme/catechol 2,3-dioxygenase-like lactoylglutathione lyase family enzyme